MDIAVARGRNDLGLARSSIAEVLSSRFIGAIPVQPSDLLSFLFRRFGGRMSFQTSLM